MDERERREVCLRRMQVAYHVGFKGTSPEVLEGRAEEILREKYQEEAQNGGGGGTGRKRKRETTAEKGQKGIEEFVNAGKRSIDPK